MRDRYRRPMASQGGAKRTRCVALNNDQLGRSAQHRSNGGGDGRGMCVGIILARAFETRRDVTAKAVFAEPEPAMLAGQDY